MNSPKVRSSPLPRNDHLDPCLSHHPLPLPGPQHSMAHIHHQQDHHPWKEPSLGSNGSSLTPPSGRRYKASHQGYCPTAKACPPKTFPLTSTFPYCSHSMSFLWRSWLNTLCSSFGASSTKAWRKPKISHPLPLHLHHHHPLCPWRKETLLLHMPPCHLPHPLYSQ